jgi:hypothetical protein
VRFRIEQFLAGPLAQVESALVDPAFLASLADLPKLGGPELLDQRVDGDLVHQRVRYSFVGELSSAVTRFVDPAKLTWIETSVLDRRTHVTDFYILPDHYANRLTCKGRFVLAEEPGGRSTKRTAEGDLSVHIPFVGRKAEQAIISGLADHARMEAECVGRWLAQHA